MTIEDPTANARHQIGEALLSYCRGIDRLDPAATLAAYHPGAILVDYGPEPMTVEAFVDYAMAKLGAKYRATQHRISNTRVEFDDGPNPTGATVETYVLAFHVEPADGEDRLVTFNGRYIDRFTAVAGEWKIARRTLRTDWTQISDITEPMPGGWVASGRAGSPDPLDAQLDARLDG